MYNEIEYDPADAIEAEHQDDDPLSPCAKCGDLWPESEFFAERICPDCAMIRDGILPPIEERWKIWEPANKEEA